MTLKMQQPLFDNRMNFTDANFKLSQTIYKWKSSFSDRTLIDKQ